VIPSVDASSFFINVVFFSTSCFVTTDGVDEVLINKGDDFGLDVDSGEDGGDEDDGLDVEEPVCCAEKRMFCGLFALAAIIDGSDGVAEAAVIGESENWPRLMGVKSPSLVQP